MDVTISDAAPARLAALLPILLLGALGGRALAQTQTICSLDPQGTVLDVEFHAYSPAASRDGRFIVYASDYDIPSNRSIVYRHDRETGVVEMVSVKSDGKAISGSIYGSTISADGRWCAFVTASKELDPTHPDFSLQIYLRDMDSGTTERVSVDVPLEPRFGAYDAWLPQLSSDGSTIVFQVIPYELPDWDESYAYLCVRDRLRGTTELLVPTIDGAPPERGIDEPHCSEDGRFVVFSTLARNIVPGDVFWNTDVFLLDRSTGIVELVSRPADGSAPYYNSSLPHLSADGAWIAFQSEAPNLVAFDHPVTWPKTSVFLYDRTQGTIELVSRRADGDPADGESYTPTVAENGRFVAFTSEATDLAGANPNPSGWYGQVFVADRDRGITRMLSINDRGEEARVGAFFPVISPDGSTIVYASHSDNLVGPHVSALLAHDRLIEHVASWSNYGAGWPGTHGVPQFTIGADPVLGTSIEVHVDHSAGTPYGIGFLLLGFAPAQLPTRHGGEILVDAFSVLPFPLYANGTTFDECVDYDASLAGLALFAQVLEFDAGASHGVSFTPGLELHLGF